MKAQERHHLKENEFAVRAAWVAEQLTTNLNKILAVVAHRLREAERSING